VTAGAFVVGTSAASSASAIFVLVVVIVLFSVKLSGNSTLPRLPVAAACLRSAARSYTTIRDAIGPGDGDLSAGGWIGRG
jgi:galactitol-specific phosphotransferase system IIC component